MPHLISLIDEVHVFQEWGKERILLLDQTTKGIIIRNQINGPGLPLPLLNSEYWSSKPVDQGTRVCLYG
jgi:hypothetical protein